MKNSLAYSVAKKLKSPKSYVKKTQIKGYKQTVLTAVQYAKQVKIMTRDITPAKTAKTAVVIHLYYTESWGQISNGLKNLKIPFDLFISVPKQNIEFKRTITADYPSAYVYETPNRGRDVLPFVKITPVLINKGYQYVLKLHSKKSTHRKDGGEWLSDIVSGLLPEKKDTLDELVSILDNKNTGIVGPQGQYLQLTVNFEANGSYMERLLNSIYRDKKKTDLVLQTKRADYGFFAGTMFWARLDAIQPIFNKKFSVRNFAPEVGQIDGTFAHALERVFCLVSEIDGKDMYEIGLDGIEKIAYKTDNIPDWSGVYISPKA